MAPQYDDDWSDSDDDAVSDVETSVQLGIPDGPLESASDCLDAAVSRIGGLPAFLTSPEPPFESALCKNCSTPMELLVHVWCPMESSPCDRALYVWGCARGVCQKLEGSVRAWRGLRYNEKYAVRLERKRAIEHEKELAKAKAAEEQARRKSTARANPFSMISSVATPGPIGLGSQIFGQTDSSSFGAADDADDDVKEAGAQPGKPPASEDENDEDEDGDEDVLVAALATATLETSDWASAPAYDALYLSTVAEYLPSDPKPKIPPSAQVNDDDVEAGRSKDSSWAPEGYENSLEVDHAFERFSKRVSSEGKQCLRYELGGVPLPFASDKVFDRLFPPPPKPTLPVTKPASMVVPAAKRTFDPSSIPACPHCKGKRIFECQLMPNLINVLKKSGGEEREGKQPSDEERRKEVEKLLKGGADVEKAGMEWGTCLVFSCANDCCVDNSKEAKYCWREEVVLTQWDA